MYNEPYSFIAFIHHLHSYRSHLQYELKYADTV